MNPVRLRFPKLPPIALLAALSAAPGITAQSPDSERGRPLVRVHTMAEFRGHSQLHAPAAGPDGLLYFGNQLAVLRWDGIRWETLEHPLPFSRALAFTPDGRLALADDNALGLLSGLGPGQTPAYTSLLESLPADWAPLGRVRQLLLHENALLAVTDTKLARITPSPALLARFDSPAAPHALSHAGKLLLARAGEGVFHITPTGPTLLATPPTGAPPQSRILLAPTPSGPVAFTAETGLAPLPATPGTSLTPFPQNTPAASAPTALLPLPDGRLALGTAGEGVRILDTAGRVLRRLTRESGLPSDAVLGLLADRDAGLWVTTNNGPARIQLDSPVTLFDKELGLPDTRSRSFARHNGTLHLLTTDGLYRVEPSAPDTGRPARVTRDPRVPPQARLSSLLSHPTGLLFAGTVGLQRLRDDGTTIEDLVSVPEGSWCVVPSPTEPSRLYIGLEDGVRTGRFTPDGSWIDEGNLPGIEADSCALHETPDGTLWVGTVRSGLFRATRGSDGWRNPAIQRIGTAEGLPEGHGMLFLYPSPAGLLISTVSGFYLPEENTARVRPAPAWTVGGRTGLIFDPISPGAPGELWTNGIAQSHDAPFPLLRLRFDPKGNPSFTETPPVIRTLLAPFGANPILWEPDPAGGPGVIWAKGEGPLLRIDLDIYAAGPQTPAPTLRTLQSGGRPLAPAGGRIELPPNSGLTLSLAPGHLGPQGRREFQHRLLPAAEEWTPWSSEPLIALTSLPSGRHRLEIRQREAGGAPSPATLLPISVGRPWYATLPALLLWALAAALFAALVFRARTATLRREQLRLESLVHERTEELRLARDAAESASREKSAFLANMSHELRTPLNAILGYAQLLLRDPGRPPQDRERLAVVNRSGEHLLRMINEVLDLSKIEAGRMELRPQPFSPSALLQDIAAAARIRAQAKGLDFQFEIPDSLPQNALGDPQKLRQILDNLLSNAIKFTPEGIVRLDLLPPPGPALPGTASPGTAGLQARTPPNDDPTTPQIWRFRVTDTGPGIPPEEQARVFEPFSQARTAAATSEPGTGLGLPISARFARMLGGDLRLTSIPGEGSVFELEIPLEPLPLQTSTPSRTPFELPPPTGYEGPAAAFSSWTTSPSTAPSSATSSPPSASNSPKPPTAPKPSTSSRPTASTSSSPTSACPA
jgi:signal transduction histidine kinase